MKMIEKLQSIMILIAVGIGLLLGQISFFEQNADTLILPFLLLMLYGLFLTVPINNIKSALKNIKFLSISTMINFVWTPLLAWGLGAIFLSDQPALWLGFILFLVTPCTDWYLIFTSIAKGNMPLSTSLLPVNLILQVLFLPIYLFIFAGAIETVDFTTMIESVLFVLFAPFLLAHVTRYLFRKNKTFLKEKLVPFFASSQIVFLCLAIVAMFASQGDYLLNHPEVILLILMPLLFFFIINFIAAQTAGKFFKFSYEDTVSLNMTIVARNSPIALAIVVSAFPDQPLIALALIVGPLIELPVLAMVAQALLLIRKRSVVAKKC
ncbi:arsenic resistance protein [Oceanobacillus jeddahense]|uniref:arsenic resistance protein n=1 Tax=Oceanobacillus jeddahense TaxID=1462527 RepID=UPI0005959ADF|nr:arsenic resistance protein [Oceanobacillus jeddahense]